MGGNIEIVRLLLTYGADPNEKVDIDYQGDRSIIQRIEGAINPQKGHSELLDILKQRYAPPGYNIKGDDYKGR